MSYFIPFIVFLVLVITSYTDIKNRIIPDIIVFPGIIVVVVFNLFIDPTYVLWFYLLGLIPGIAMLLLKLFKNHFGGGDVKLMFFLGLALGGYAPLFVLGVSLILIIVYKLIQAFVPVGNESVPMAPFALIGVFTFYIVSAFFGVNLIG